MGHTAGFTRGFSAGKPRKPRGEWAYLPKGRGALQRGAIAESIAESIAAQSAPVNTEIAAGKSPKFSR